MRYLLSGVALLMVFAAGVLTCVYLPFGYLENGASVAELKLSRVSLAGKSYYAVTGYDASDVLYRADPEMIVRGTTCNIRIGRSLFRHGQRSGEFAYLFGATPSCSRVTFGERQFILWQQPSS
jgi:hypothetical protein